MSIVYKRCGKDNVVSVCTVLARGEAFTEHREPEKTFVLTQRNICKCGMRGSEASLSVFWMETR